NCVDLLHAGDVRRLRAPGAQFGGRRAADYGGDPGRHLFQSAQGLSRRCDRLRRAGARHVGAHSPLPQHAVLRGSVRDVLTLERCLERHPRSPGMLRDLRLAVRMLLQAKGWTAVVLLSLALGIGANTALFSAIDGLLLRKLPVHDPDTLVRFRYAGANQMRTDV